MHGPIKIARDTVGKVGRALGRSLPVVGPVVSGIFADHNAEASETRFRQQPPARPDVRAGGSRPPTTAAPEQDDADRGRPGLSSATVALNTLNPMNFTSVQQWLTKFLAEELADVSPADVAASLQALQRYQKRLRRKAHEALPGDPAFPNRRLNHGLISGCYHFCRLATAVYGWKGLAFFKLTDPVASYGLGDLKTLGTSLLKGDGYAFCQLAGLPASALLYESKGPDIGVPKHFVAVDDASMSVVLCIRGTMAFNDVLTDLLAEPVPFGPPGGYAHKGIAHGAERIYEELHGLLEAEVLSRKGYGLVITGHSLGAATAMLLTIHIHSLKAAQAAALGLPPEQCQPFPGRNIHCYAYAPPPVFGPLEALPEPVAQSITALVHNDDIISRLSVESIRELLEVLRSVSAAHPSWLGRMFSDVELERVLDRHPGWGPATGGGKMPLAGDDAGQTAGEGRFDGTSAAHGEAQLRPGNSRSGHVDQEDRRRVQASASAYVGGASAGSSSEQADAHATAHGTTGHGHAMDSTANPMSPPLVSMDMGSFLGTGTEGRDTSAATDHVARSQTQGGQAPPQPPASSASTSNATLAVPRGHAGYPARVPGTVIRSARPSTAGQDTAMPTHRLEEGGEYQEYVLVDRPHATGEAEGGGGNGIASAGGAGDAAIPASAADAAASAPRTPAAGRSASDSPSDLLHVDMDDVETEEMRRRVAQAHAALRSGGHDHGSPRKDSSGLSSDTYAHVSATDVLSSHHPPPRFQIPGTIYMFRAPVDVGASEGMRDDSRCLNGNGSADGRAAGSGSHAARGPAGAARDLDAKPTSSPRSIMSGLSAVASWVPVPSMPNLLPWSSPKSSPGPGSTGAAGHGLTAEGNGTGSAERSTRRRSRDDTAVPTSLEQARTEQYRQDRSDSDEFQHGARTPGPGVTGGIGSAGVANNVTAQSQEFSDWEALHDVSSPPAGGHRANARTSDGARTGGQHQPFLLQPADSSSPAALAPPHARMPAGEVVSMDDLHARRAAAAVVPLPSSSSSSGWSSSASEAGLAGAHEANGRSAASSAAGRTPGQVSRRTSTENIATGQPSGTADGDPAAAAQLPHLHGQVPAEDQHRPGPGQATSAGQTTDNDVHLAPGVAAQAQRLALDRDTLPFVTIVRTHHLGRLPITDTAWRDHVPDMYLFGLRQLREVAQRQMEDALAGTHGPTAGQHTTPGPPQAR